MNGYFGNSHICCWFLFSFLFCFCRGLLIPMDYLNIKLYKNSGVSSFSEEPSLYTCSVEENGGTSPRDSPRELSNKDGDSLRRKTAETDAIIAGLESTFIGEKAMERNRTQVSDKKRHRHTLHLITEGPGSGAVCLDGSPPGYYMRKGLQNKWIIYLQGGAWCYNPEMCYKRSGTELGSSKCFPRSFALEGFLSSDPKMNPDFYNWTSIFVASCDGAFFSGDRKKPFKVKGKRLYFRGRRILDLFIDVLLRKGLGNASDVILGGRSAGALATLLNADHFRSRLPRSISFYALSDSGLFLDVPSLNGSEIVRSQMKQMFKLHNCSSGVNQACLKTQKRDERWKCIFPQYSIPHIRSSLFVVNSLYDTWQIAFLSDVHCVLHLKTCSSVERAYIMNRRRTTLEALKSALKSRNAAFFLDSCLVHTQCVRNDCWNTIKVADMTIAKAFARWYFNRGQNVTKNLIDCSYPCNPTCPLHYRI